MEHHLNEGARASNAPGHSSRPTANVRVACEYCKRAKTKCDGDVPCQACTARKIPCILDISKDGRRGRKRTLDQLRSQANNLETLLDSLKYSDDQSFQEMIQLIRNEAPLNDIIQRAEMLASQHDQNRNKLRARTRRTALDIAALTDQPPIRVPAKPWTNVTDDDHAVSHLISIYFTWQHYGYPSVDQDTFVSAMFAKDLSSPFCSPFLVNSMLAVACVYTDHPLAFADPNDPSSRATHFLDETTKLWRTEQEKPSLTNLQALPPLITCLAALGRDRAGFRYTTQSIALTTELVGEVKKGVKRGNQTFASAAFQRSYTLALWGLFLVQTEVSVAWSKPFDLNKPSREHRCTAEELRLTRTWSCYPKPSPELLHYPNIFITEIFRLYEIAAELRPLVLSGSPQDSPLPGYIILEHEAKISRLRDIEQKLLEWQQNLPLEACIGDKDHSVPTEPLINLHLVYNSFRISTANQIFRIDGIAQSVKDDMAENTISICQTIASLYEWRQRTTGLFYFGIYNGHAASLSAYSLLDHLTRPGIPDVFHTVIVALSATSHRWFIARGIVKMIWIELQQRKLVYRLNPSTLSLLKLGAVDTWSSEDHELVKRCAYPNYAAVGERGPALSEMGDLIDEYVRLNLADDASELPDS